MSVLPIQFLAAANDESFVTELRRMPEGWFAVAGLALLAFLWWAAAWMYRTEGRVGASGRVRVMLAVIRCLILLTLAVILLEPIRVHILYKRIDSYSVVLVDSSSSMGLSDRYRDANERERVRNFLGLEDAPAAMPRTDLASSLLTRDHRDFLHRLAAKNRVRLAAFADDSSNLCTLWAAGETAPGGASASAHAAETAGALTDVDTATIAFNANGPATNIERALHRMVESLAGAPIAGVVVLTDGGFNSGAGAEEVARYAREQHVPLHVVGIGDPSPPRNVRVVETQAPENAFKKDPFAITATLAAQGLDGETIHVRFRERRADDVGEGREIETKSVTVKPGGVIEPLVFQRAADQVGRYVYTVEVEPVEDESIADDNARQTTVNVVDSKTKVLIVAGEPSWDYRFVSTLLTRDETVDVACWLQSADMNAVRDGDIFIDHLPATADELFAYDVIILMDPEKSEFDANWAELADKFVSQHGGGLLYAAARAHAPAFLREQPLKPMFDLLPVVFDPEADLVLNQIGHYQTAPSLIEFPPAAFSHPILRLSDDPVANKLAWQGIGDIYWHYPVLREKPVATVLMRDADPKMRGSGGGHVLAAVQFVGPGRSAFLAFDTSWKWRRFTEEMYDRFWVQMVRFLSEGKLLGGSRRGTLTVENDHPTLGETIAVSARLLDAQFEPLKRDQVAAHYEIAGERRELSLAAQPDRPGSFGGQFVPDRTGAYRIMLTMPSSGAAEPVELQHELLVTRPNLELLRPQMNRAELVTLAEQSAGGKFWEIDEANGIPDAIPDLHEEIPVRSRPTTLWDNGVTLGILVALMTVEWAVRKCNRLL
ncbi:MAG: hypothetical protein HY287_01990 [Planctomycetes bacterium]|nr:hypothetical protein [Planctomycetota bacterium]MBI3833081.1 hypothetical protein [Planctomycetota bacterium]